MLPIQIVLTAVVFVGSLLAVSFVWWAAQTRREARQRQLALRVGNVMEDDRILRLREADQVGRSQGRIRGHLNRLLRRAGDERTDVQLLALMGALGGGGVLLLFWPLGFPGSLLGLVLGAIPYVALQSEAKKRSRKFTEQLPEALDLIGRTLRAGRAFSDALRLTSQELPAPIGEELVQVSEEHRLGIELRECLLNLLDRNPDNWDLRLFVSSVLLQRETGGNLIETLEHLGETIRERLIFESKVEALTAEVRFSAFVLGFLPFLVTGALLLVQPYYLAPLVTTTLGRMLLLGGVLSLITGALVMRRLAQVEAA